MTDPEDEQIEAAELRVGDMVDPESCPFLIEWEYAEFEYATVLDVDRIEGGDIRVEYADIPGYIYYWDDQPLRIKPRSSHPAGYYEQF